MLVVNAVVELVWQDETGSTAITSLHGSPSSTYADIDAAATAMASILASLTGAVLIGQRIKYKAVPETPSVASGGASIRRTGVFFFSVADSDPMALIMVHAIKASLVVADGILGGVAIDTSNSDVITFINAIIDNGISSPFGDDITTFEAAYMQSRV